jgi:hypothetical protein
MTTRSSTRQDERYRFATRSDLDATALFARLLDRPLAVPSDERRVGRSATSVPRLRVGQSWSPVLAVMMGS